ncbi:outer membrane beta-barrel protein [Chitinophaga deserti]|uniref:outer membrane beta-barrel protein n=1 Tax=Chitinophaga deserti TaxID=2164099 RepID=UPI0013008C5E|nr:outer membrane beta-barrel protein [Chitinophaga deserti]
MKKLLLLLGVSLTATCAYSQSFMHGAGVAVFVEKYKDVDAGTAVGFTYSPRFNFVESESMSVSVGIPISLAFSGSGEYNSRTGASDDAKLGILINAPVMVNLNFGAGSSPDNESRFGGFIGGGGGFHWGASTEQFDQNGNVKNVSGTTFGYAANAGMRIALGDSGKNIEIKASYFKGVNEGKLDLIGVAGIFNF